MIQQSFPAGTQRAAAHCEALITRHAAPQEFVRELELFGERLAAALRPVLAAVQVRSLGARPVSVGELAEHCGALCAASVHTFGPGERSLLLSFEARALLAQLDRAFGGTGDIGKVLPVELPLSADLLAQRMERQVAAAVAGELGGIELRSGERGGSVAQLLPYIPSADLTLLEFEVSPEAGAPWRISLAVESEALPALLPRSAAARPSASGRQRGDAGSAPFADLPLTASATLVDMEVPLHRVVALAPGDVLPIMVARSVPLQIGEAVIARGTVGEVDKQVALQITQISFGKDTQ
jgi:flagellar motor switch protein FliM